MENIRRVNWDIDGNDFLACVNNFGLCVVMGVVNDEEDDNKGSIKFVLAVYSFSEKKRTYCGFSSLEDAMFFVNKYVTRCNSISEIDSNYNNYCISNYVINEKGYTS